MYFILSIQDGLSLNLGAPLHCTIINNIIPLYVCCCLAPASIKSTYLRYCMGASIDITSSCFQVSLFLLIVPDTCVELRGRVLGVWPPVMPQAFLTALSPWERCHWCHPSRGSKVLVAKFVDSLFCCNPDTWKLSRYLRLYPHGRTEQDTWLGLMSEAFLYLEVYWWQL